MTWDGGRELAPTKKFTIATGVAVYFCDPPTAPGSEARTRTL